MKTAPRIAKFASAMYGPFREAVDFVGGRILELNVFSPGGLVPSERLCGVDFGGAVIDAFERSCGG